MQIKISVPTLLQQFHPCSGDYIQNTCRGRCCQGTGKIMVTVHDSEIDKFKAKGATIEGNFIQQDARGLCPFKSDEGFCNVHDDKPFGCAASPFTLSKKGVLIIRNRYRMLRCFKCAGAMPAYKAHRFSLTSIFGEVETARICDEMDAGTFNGEAVISAERYQMLIDNDSYKKALG